MQSWLLLRVDAMFKDIIIINYNKDLKVESMTTALYRVSWN